MFKKISSEIIKLSPRAAERFLTLNIYPHQRPLRPNWVSDLANFAREGTFLTGHIAIAEIWFDMETGASLDAAISIMVNGQHQCNAIITANKTVDANLEKFVCNNPEDLSLLYRQFDNNKGRSLQNIVKFEAGAIGLKWPVKAASLLVTAAAHKEGLERAHKNRKVEVLADYLKQGEFLNRLLFVKHEGTNLKDYAHMMRSPVVLAMLYTWEKSQADSEKFWTQVRDGIDLKRDMPSKKVMKFLERYTYAHGNGARGPHARMVNLKEMTSKCITGWNAFRKGVPTDLKYYPDKPIPKAI